MTRLRAVQRTTDGFELAELDIALRKEGELLGLRQSGLPPLRVARLADPRHRELSLVARRRRSAWSAPTGGCRPATSCWSGSSPAAGWRASARATCWTRTSSMPDAGRVIRGQRRRSSAGGARGGHAAVRGPGQAGAVRQPGDRPPGAAGGSVPGPVRGQRRGGHRGAQPGRPVRGVRGARCRERPGSSPRTSRRTAPGGRSGGARRRAALPRWRCARSRGAVLGGRARSAIRSRPSCWMTPWSDSRTRTRLAAGQAPWSWPSIPGAGPGSTLVGDLERSRVRRFGETALTWYRRLGP